MLKNSLLVFLGACSFGILSTFVKLAYAEGYTLGEVTGVQVFFGMIMLWALYFLGKASKIIKEQIIFPRDPIWKMIICGFSTGLVSVTYYKCVQQVPASIAIILLMQFVWISILLEFLLFRSRPSKAQLWGMFLVVGGTLLAAGLFNTETLNLSTEGVFYGLLAATFYAIFMMVNSRMGKGYPAIQKSALFLTGSCVLIFLLFPPLFLFNGVISGNLWKWGIILSVFGTVIPPLFFAVGIPKIGVTTSSIISAAELPVAVLMSYFILSEPVTHLQWIGVFVMLSAIALSNILGKKSAFKR